MANKKNKAKTNKAKTKQPNKVIQPVKTADVKQTNTPTDKIVTKNTNSKKNSKDVPISNKGIDLLKQFGLESTNNQEFIEETDDDSEKEIKEKKKNKGPVPSHADSIGWNKPLILLKNFMYGFFMGISDGIPGYSGGTTLTIIGFYQQLINNFKLIFKPDVKKYFWKYLLWILPFIAAWIGTMYGFMQIVNLASENNSGIVLVFLFGSFALFSIPLFLLANKSKMINIKDFAQATKKKEKWTLVHWIMIIVAFLLLVGVGIGARFLPTTTLVDANNNSFIVNGVTFAKSTEEWVGSNVDTMNILFLLFAGMIAGFCMLIPGISGSLVLFMTTWYPKISQAISQFTTDINYLPWLVVAAAGMILGIILSTMTISYFLKRWEKIFYSAALGLILASPIAIFTALSSYEYGMLANSTTLILSLSMIVAAIIVNVLIFIALNETKKIDFPKLRIFNRSAIKKD